MTEEVVSFEVAKLAKEKGFKEKCIQYYMYSNSEDTKGILNRSYEKSGTNFNNWFDDDKIKYTSAPTQSLLQRWLREVHKIEIKVELMSDFHNKDQYYPELGYIYDVLCFTKEEDGKVLRDIISSSGAPTYEKALDLALYVGLGFIDSPFRRKNKLV